MLSQEYNQLLLKRSGWLIKIRWIAVICLIIAILFTKEVFNLNIDIKHLFILVFILFFQNLLFLLIQKKLKKQKFQKIFHTRIFINIQILLDFVLLTFILHYSGGTENPFIVFYIFHIIIASILLPKKDSCVQTTIAVILYVLLIYFEYTGIIKHFTLNNYISLLILEDKMYLISAVAIFIVTSYLVFFLTSSISQQIFDQQKDLFLANKKLEERDIIKNEYVLRITHDINGHISVIRNNLYILKMELYEGINKDYKQHIQAGYNRTLKLKSFIEDLLKLTKMRLTDKLDKKSIDIKQLILQIITDYKQLYEDKSIELNIMVDAGLVVYGNEISLAGLFSNLLENAINYTQERGEIKILASQKPNQIIIEIHDNGCGIPDDDIPKIFEEFHRGQNVKDSKDGTGLGLSIVKQILKNHGGEIHVESELDKGTSFYVILPSA